MTSFLKQCLIKKMRPRCVLSSGILIHLFNFDFKNLGSLHFLSARWRKLLVNRSVNFQQLCYLSYCQLSHKVPVPLQGHPLSALVRLSALVFSRYP